MLLFMLSWMCSLFLCRMPFVILIVLVLLFFVLAILHLPLVNCVHVGLHDEASPCCVKPLPEVFSLSFLVMLLSMLPFPLQSPFYLIFLITVRSRHSYNSFLSFILQNVSSTSICIVGTFIVCSTSSNSNSSSSHMIILTIISIITVIVIVLCVI